MPDTVEKAVKIGSRKSQLALWQTEHVASLLQQQGLETEIILQETKGDQQLDVSIAKIGSKGVFTQELESLLAEGKIHIAVHSAKDMQSTLPEGFEIIAFTERESIEDVILSEKDIELKDPNLVIGTSSTRRIAQLAYYYPHLRTVEIRGNLQTRIRKMQEGHCDALMLAFAGVHRMGYDRLIRYRFPLDQITPAVGQGSLAIESHDSVPDDLKQKIRMIANHGPTEKRLLAERAFLKKLEGGCSIPVFGLAELNETDKIQMKGGVIRLNGSEMITQSIEGMDPVQVGEQLASLILEAGGDKILREIRNLV